MELKSCKCFRKFTTISFSETGVAGIIRLVWCISVKYYDKTTRSREEEAQTPTKQLHLKVCLSTAHLEQIKSWITFLKTSCRPTCLGNDGAEGWDGCYLNESAAVMKPQTSSSLSITSKFNTSWRKLICHKTSGDF